MAESIQDQGSDHVAFCHVFFLPWTLSRIFPSAGIVVTDPRNDPRKRSNIYYRVCMLSCFDVVGFVNVRQAADCSHRQINRPSRDLVQLHRNKFRVFPMFGYSLREIWTLWTLTILVIQSVIFKFVNISSWQLIALTHRTKIWSRQNEIIRIEILYIYIYI